MYSPLHALYFSQNSYWHLFTELFLMDFSHQDTWQLSIQCLGRVIEHQRWIIQEISMDTSQKVYVCIYLLRFASAFCCFSHLLSMLIDISLKYLLMLVNLSLKHLLKLVYIFLKYLPMRVYISLKHLPMLVYISLKYLLMFIFLSSIFLCLFIFFPSIALCLFLFLSTFCCL